MNTETAAAGQEPIEGGAQASISTGDIMMACVEPDVAQQNAIKLAAREAIDRHPNLSWAQKGFLGALVGRINFRTGTVQDAHEFLARWFNTSLTAVRRHRAARAAGSAATSPTRSRCRLSPKRPKSSGCSKVSILGCSKPSSRNRAPIGEPLYFSAFPS